MMPFQVSSQPQCDSSGVDVMPPSYLHTRPESWTSAPLNSQSLVKGCPGVMYTPRHLKLSEPVGQAGSGGPRDVLQNEPQMHLLDAKTC